MKTFFYKDIVNILESNGARIIGNIKHCVFDNIASLSNRNEFSLDWSRSNVATSSTCVQSNRG